MEMKQLKEMINSFSMLLIITKSYLSQHLVTWSHLIEFYQTYWDINKEDIMEFFDDFHQGRLDISVLNYGIITFVGYPY